MQKCDGDNFGSEFNHVDLFLSHEKKQRDIICS